MKDSFETIDLKIVFCFYGAVQKRNLEKNVTRDETVVH